LLYKLIRAAVTARPGRTEIVLDRDQFPTDRYVAAGIAEECGLTLRWIEVDPSAGVTPELLTEAVGPQTALVLLNHVAYRSARLAGRRAGPDPPRPGRRRARPLGPLPLGGHRTGRARRLGGGPGGRL